MEDSNSNEKRKRVRDESSNSLDSETHLVNSPDTKTRRVNENTVSDVNSSESQLTRVDSVESIPYSLFDSDTVQDDIFHIFDNPENVPERDSVVSLDSVIKSFEDEIQAPGSETGQTDPIQKTGSGEMEMNLGYLFEASDDELGLPPTVVPGDEPGRVEPENVDLTGFLGFEDDFGFDFGTGLLPESNSDMGVAGDFVAVEPAADVLWRSESLQAM